MLKILVDWMLDIEIGCYNVELLYVDFLWC